LTQKYTNITGYKLSTAILLQLALAFVLGLISHQVSAQTVGNRKPTTETIIVESPAKVKTICIDAGHGGKDPGCHGQYSNEKDITLAIALRVESMLKAYYKNINVVQTRSTDIFWELEERGSIANAAQADVFVSIHVNSTPRKVGTSSGTETFVLGLHRTDDKENALSEKDNHDEGDSKLDRNDPLTRIKVAQYMQAFLNQSISLGSKIEQNFANQGRLSKGVKQEGWGVLAHTGMPAVLVEIGFLNNPEEEAYLNSEQGQIQVATAIFNGIKAYKEEMEKPAAAAPPTTPSNGNGNQPKQNTPSGEAETPKPTEVRR
jgi:N-acetylmuramoyl-L-alanine amidase